MASSESDFVRKYKTEQTEEVLVGEGDETLELPSSLVNSEDFLTGVLSLSTWNSLSTQTQQNLVKLLPTFEQNDQKEKLKTLKMLLSGQSIRFGVSPVQDFKAKMTSGKFNPEKVRMQRLLRKIQRRLDKKSMEQRELRLMAELIGSIGEHQTSNAGNHITPPADEQASTSARDEFFSTEGKISNKLEMKIAARYFRELRMIRREVDGGEESSTTDTEEDTEQDPDPNLPGGMPAKVPAVDKTKVRKAYEELLKAHNGGPIRCLPRPKNPPAPPPAPASNESSSKSKSKHKYSSNHIQAGVPASTNKSNKHNLVNNPLQQQPQSSPLRSLLINNRPTAQIHPDVPASAPSSGAAAPLLRAEEDKASHNRASTTKPPPKVQHSNTVSGQQPSLLLLNHEQKLPQPTQSVQQEQEEAEEERRLLLHSLPPSHQQPAVASSQQQQNKREQQQQIHLQKNSANQINLTPAASQLKQPPGIPKGHHQAGTPAQQQPVNKPAVAVPTASMADPAAEAVANIPGMEPTNSLVADAVANIPGMDAVEEAVANIPLDFPSQQSHKQSCYFAVLRDKFRSYPGYSVRIPCLREDLRSWEDHSLAMAASSGVPPPEPMLDNLPSAMAFLLGAYPSECRPTGFIPLVECSSSTSSDPSYTWIGSGRDSDIELSTLTDMWKSVKHLTRGNFDLPGFSSSSVNSSEGLKGSSGLGGLDGPEASVGGEGGAGAGGPPSPPTNTMLTPRDFHSQEHERMSKPLKPYTYVLADHPAPIAVGPVRINHSSSASNKVKPHPLLFSTRPAFVTFIVLVQDALARLPNGVGTKTDICMLVKDSQYVNQDAVVEGWNALTAVVSGALDRLQGEYDPPCKYMSDKKMWRYLHMGRSEEEFMRKHNEKMCGHKLPKDKKAEKRKKTAVETAAVDLPSQEELMQSAVASILGDSAPANETSDFLAVDNGKRPRNDDQQLLNVGGKHILLSGGNGESSSQHQQPQQTHLITRS